nr:hypothetical protein [Pandoravirus massiliensis]
MSAERRARSCANVPATLFFFSLSLFSSPRRNEQRRALFFPKRQRRDHDHVLFFFVAPPLFLVCAWIHAASSVCRDAADAAPTRRTQLATKTLCQCSPFGPSFPSPLSLFSRENTRHHPCRLCGLRQSLRVGDYEKEKIGSRLAVRLSFDKTTDHFPTTAPPCVCLYRITVFFSSPFPLLCVVGVTR